MPADPTRPETPRVRPSAGQETGPRGSCAASKQSCSFCTFLVARFPVQNQSAGNFLELMFGGDFVCPVLVLGKLGPSSKPDRDLSDVSPFRGMWLCGDLC